MLDPLGIEFLKHPSVFIGAFMLKNWANEKNLQVRYVVEGPFHLFTKERAFATAFFARY